MINNFVSALQLILILISVFLLIYLIIIKGDNNRCSYMMFLINLCMLWTVLI